MATKKRVFKGSPEEQATLAEIESLISELKMANEGSQSLDGGDMSDGLGGGPSAAKGMGQAAMGAQNGGSDYDDDNDIDAIDDEINGKEPNMSGSRQARKAANMPELTGDDEIAPKTSRIQPNGTGDDNWGDDNFGVPDDESEPEPGRKGAGTQDNGSSTDRYKSFGGSVDKASLMAHKAKLMKQLARVTKDIEATPHDGHDNLDSADEILSDLPQYDIDDIEDLSRATGVSTVAVQKTLQAVAKRLRDRNRQIQAHRVNKSLMARVERSESMLAEVLAGLQGAAGAVQDPNQGQRTVQKSQNRRPVASYPGAGGEDILSRIADMVVEKGGGARRSVGSGDAEIDAILGDDNQTSVVRKSMHGFAEMFGQSAKAWH